MSVRALLNSVPGIPTWFYRPAAAPNQGQTPATPAATIADKTFIHPATTDKIRAEAGNEPRVTAGIVPPHLRQKSGLLTRADFAPLAFESAPKLKSEGALPPNVALAQIDVVPNRPDLNVKRMLAEIEAAKARGVELIIFPEMCVPGYMIGDHWKYDRLVDDFVSYNEDILQASRGITVIWGNAYAENGKVNESGARRLYNAAFVASDGKWVNNGVFEGRTYKTLLPNYGKFDDKRYFHSLAQVAREEDKKLSDMMKPFEIKIGGKTVKIGVMLCEDMWQDDYADKPVDILAANGAEMIVNLSCSPWSTGKIGKRNEVVASALTGKNVPLVYVNNVGSQNIGKTVFTFDGSSSVYRGDGALLRSAAFFAEQTMDFNLAEILAAEPRAAAKDDGIEQIHDALVYAIRKFFGGRRVMIGLSGGIDSAVVAALLVEALGPDKVFATNMPSKYNSDITKNGAFELAKNLGIHYAVVPIQDLVELTEEVLENAEYVRLHPGADVTLGDLTPARGFLGKLKRRVKGWFRSLTGAASALTRTGIELSGLNKENIQARTRGSTILSGLSSALHAFYTNNGNKVEFTPGYATIYGDVNGAAAILGDLEKEEVYALARHINARNGRELIPQAIIDVMPSAELSDDQDVDEGKGDPFKFPYHGWLFRAWQEYMIHPEDILRMYDENAWTDGLKLHPKNKKNGQPHPTPRDFVHAHFRTAKDFVEDMEKYWKLFHASVFKRIQSPPVISVKRSTYGHDFREAQMDAYLTRGFRRLKDKILSD